MYTFVHSREHFDISLSLTDNILLKNYHIYCEFFFKFCLQCKSSLEPWYWDTQNLLLGFKVLLKSSTPYWLLYNPQPKFNLDNHKYLPRYKNEYFMHYWFCDVQMDVTATQADSGGGEATMSSETTMPEEVEVSVGKVNVACNRF